MSHYAVIPTVQHLFAGFILPRSYKNYANVTTLYIFSWQTSGTKSKAFKILNFVTST